MANWVHLNQECPATSSSRDIPLHTLPVFVWTRVLQDDSIGGIILRIRSQSREKPFLAYVESVCQYHKVFRQQCPTDYRSQLLVPRRLRHHVVRHRLLTSLRYIDQQFSRRCVVECGILIHGNLLRLQSRFLHQYASLHDFQQRHANFTPKKQLMMPWRH